MAQSSLRSLSLDEDLPFQRKQWRLERIAWVTMTALIVYSLAGGLGGGGPLSSTNGFSADRSAQVHYERFARQLSPHSVEITVRQPPDGRAVEIRLGGDYLGSMSVKSIVPHPDATTAADGGHVFVFKRLPGVVETRIELQLEAQKIGSVEGWLAVNSGERLAIKQFVFP